MNTILLLLLVVTMFWLIFAWSGPCASGSAHDTREQVMARVLLHDARRRRQLAELERAINDGAARRLAELEQEDWPEAGS